MIRNGKIISLGIKIQDRVYELTDWYYYAVRDNKDVTGKFHEIWEFLKYNS